MWHLIRNIEGEPRPLILHRWLHRLRVIDQHVRFAACKMLGLRYHRPRYMNAQRTVHLFVGVCSNMEVSRFLADECPSLRVMTVKPRIGPLRDGSATSVLLPTQELSLMS